MTTPFEPLDALLAVDVGNTRIGLAVWDDDGLHEARRLDGGDASTWRDQLSDIWQSTSGVKRRGIVIGSVNPERGRAVADLALEVCELDPLFVRSDLPLPLEMRIDNAREVGVDRVCAAAAAFDRAQGACAVASFGTAITIDCVSADGAFLGGAILPGLQTACDALHEHTAKLPRVLPAAPTSPFGKNTHDAIVSGVVYGAVGALREIVERFATELGEWPPLIVTGGDAPLIVEAADFVDGHIPDLCLAGIALAYRKAAGQT